MTYNVDDYPYGHSLQRLAKLHEDLANADKKWLGAATAARRINVLIDSFAEFWRDLPNNREPVLQAVDQTISRMKIVIAACANYKQMDHSFAARTLVRDTLDDLCIAIATYREGVNDD